MSHYFTGEVRWAKVHRPDQKYNKYSLDMLLDMKQYKEMKDLGLKNGGKPDDSGDRSREGKMWVTFRRNKEDGPCSVVDASGDPVSTDIGNGSICTIKLGVETFTSPKYGKITRSTVESVRVDKLVVYDPEKKEQDAQAQAQGVNPAAPSTPRPRIPF
jgi:hypothetical protein